MKTYTVFTLATIVFLEVGCTKHIHYCERFVNGNLTREPVMIGDFEKQAKPFVTTKNTSLKGTLEILSKIKASGVDYSVERNITMLQEKLDNYYSSNQNALRQSLNALKHFPCDTAARRANERLISQAIKDNLALENLRSNLRKISQDAKGIDNEQVQNALKTYVRASGDSSLHLSSLKVNNSSSSQLEIFTPPSERGYGYFFDKEINGESRAVSNIKNGHYKTELHLISDSLNLSKDFAYELRFRSLKNNTGIIGFEIDDLGPTRFFFISN